MNEMDEETEADRRFEQRLAHERQTAGRREMNTQLKFWFACPMAACRRHRQCGGDADICHATFWPVVSPEFKVWFGALGDAARDGLPVRKAGVVAADAVARWQRVQKRKGEAR